jgi:hypothetical protein
MSKFTDAMITVNGIQERLSQMPLLETLIYMEGHTDEFTLAELRDFYTVMAEFQKLFAIKETA